MRTRRVQSAIVFALAIGLYANTLGHGYALDDALVITRNASFEAEPNGAPAGALDVTGSRAVLGAIVPGNATTTITFGEFFPGRPANGTSVSGVTFGFTVNGSPSRHHNPRSRRRRGRGRDWSRTSSCATP